MYVCRSIEIYNYMHSLYNYIYPYIIIHCILRRCYMQIDHKLSTLVELIQPEPDERSLRKLLELHHILRLVNHQQLYSIVQSYMSEPSLPINARKRLATSANNNRPTVASLTRGLGCQIFKFGAHPFYGPKSLDVYLPQFIPFILYRLLNVSV